MGERFRNKTSLVMGKTGDDAIFLRKQPLRNL